MNKQDFWKYNITLAATLLVMASVSITGLIAALITLFVIASIMAIKNCG
jgi:hypothetical protein